jgi:hypothetical protein
VALRNLATALVALEQVSGSSGSLLSLDSPNIKRAEEVGLSCLCVPMCACPCVFVCCIRLCENVSVCAIQNVFVSLSNSLELSRTLSNSLFCCPTYSRCYRVPSVYMLVFVYSPLHSHSPILVLTLLLSRCAPLSLSPLSLSSLSLSPVVETCH